MTKNIKAGQWWIKAMPYVIAICGIVGIHIVFGCVFFCISLAQEFNAAYCMNPGIALITYPIVFLVGLGGTIDMFGALGLLPSLFACLICLVSRYAGPLLGIRWWLLSLLLCCGLLCIPCAAFPWGMDMSCQIGDGSDSLYSGYPRALLAFFFLVLWTALLVSDAVRR
jgi:hypothetical protein